MSTLSRFFIREGFILRPVRVREAIDRARYPMDGAFATGWVRNRCRRSEKTMQMSISRHQNHQHPGQTHHRHQNRHHHVVLSELMEAVAKVSVLEDRVRAL